MHWKYWTSFHILQKCSGIKTKEKRKRKREKQKRLKRKRGRTLVDWA
jgi:hypothetical protein